jgi:group I intron endonuclease
MNFRCVIYKHTNRKNGKVYVGKTIQVDNLERRFRHSDPTYNSYKSCTVFYRALKKHSWESFDTEIIMGCLDEEYSRKMEEFYIKANNSIAPNGYNSVELHSGVVIFTDEVRKKISDSRKEYYANLEEKPVAWNRKEHITVDGVECKHCPQCDKAKPLVEFCNNKSSWDGLWRYCRDCHQERYETKYQGKNNLSPEEFKKSYENRQKNVSAGVLKAYEDNPALRKAQSQRKSIAITATAVDTGKMLEFASAKEACKYGFNNTTIGKALKTGKAYAGYIWKKKGEV